MSKTRNNHYVPQWYQEGFFEPGRPSLAYVDMTPDRMVLPDGRVITQNGAWNDTPTSRAFFHKDLYSTFFGTSVNDEIERRLFGNIDGRGSKSVRAFSGTDVREWHKHFQTLFEYLDIQKIRTPKGLDWLKTQYPKLSQNELMYEMQGIRMMHCTIWVGGVREIVSAEDSDVKFILSDHPVTIYNHAVPPTHKMGAYPLDPGIALSVSVSDNLPAEPRPLPDPLESGVRGGPEHQSARKEDIRAKLPAVHDPDRRVHPHPEADCGGSHTGQLRSQVPRAALHRRRPQGVAVPGKDGLAALEADLRERRSCRSPKGGLFHCRRRDVREVRKRRCPLSGPVRQDREAAGVPDQDGAGQAAAAGRYVRLRVGELLPGVLPVVKPEALRPSWSERSIRERNIMLQNGIKKVLGLDGEKDWTQIRRELTDDQIKEIYFLYEALWPLETDLLALLPKPDGVARAVYTGSIHPLSIADFALAAPLYFGELIVAHPFIHSGTVAKKYRPTENPKHYRQEFLKSIMFFVKIMPLVQLGLINLIPDLCDFDFHLREQMMSMARARTRVMQFDPDKEPRLKKQMEEDNRRSLMLMPPDAMRRQLRKLNPDMIEEQVEATMRFAERKRELDPLAVLQEGSLEGGKEGGQMNMFKLAPNFEMTMYLAQATGAYIVTDSPFRWSEVKRAIRRRVTTATPGLATLSGEIRAAKFAFPQNVTDVVDHALKKTCACYPDLHRDLFKYLSHLKQRGAKPNREAQLGGRFARVHAAAQAAFKKSGVIAKEGRISCVLPPEGIQDNTINRLLLMSSSERHLSSIPMAFFIEENGTGEGSILAR